jgi:hypothetical protein
MANTASDAGRLGRIADDVPAGGLDNAAVHGVDEAGGVGDRSGTGTRPAMLAAIRPTDEAMVLTNKRNGDAAADAIASRHPGSRTEVTLQAE